MKTLYRSIPLPNGYSIQKRTIDKDMPIVHYHDCFELATMCEGEIDYEFADRTYTIRKGDIVIVNNIELHRTKNPKGAVELLLVFDRSFVENGLSPDISELFSPFFNRNASFRNVIEADAPYAQEIISDMQKIFEEDSSAQKFSRQMIQAKTVSILVLLCRHCLNNQMLNKESSTVNNIMPAIKYIDEHYKEKLHLSDMAKLCGYSREYFSALFYRATNVRFIDYLIYLRLDEAERLLLSTELSVNEICLLSGFNNMSNFLQAFRKRYGMTPTQFRKRNRL